jgi:hypothetical protein
MPDAGGFHDLLRQVQLDFGLYCELLSEPDAVMARYELNEWQREILLARDARLYQAMHLPESFGPVGDELARLERPQGPVDLNLHWSPPPVDPQIVFTNWPPPGGSPGNVAISLPPSFPDIWPIWPLGGSGLEATSDIDPGSGPTSGGVADPEAARIEEIGRRLENVRQASRAQRRDAIKRLLELL